MAAGFIGLAFADSGAANDAIPSINNKGKVRAVKPPAAAQQGGQAFAPPANDACANAIAMPGTVPSCSPIVTDVTQATPLAQTAPDASDPLTACASAAAGQYLANSIWFTYTPPATGFYVVHACIGASCADGITQTTAGDGLLSIQAGTCGAFAEVDCDDDSCGQNGPPPQGSPSKIGPVQLNGGQTYYIMAGNFTNASYSGTINQYQIRVEGANPPANDLCANAEPLVLNEPKPGFANAITQDNYQPDAACFSSFFQVGNIVAAGTGRDSVYSFTAPSADTYSFYLKYYNAGPSTTATDPNPILYISGICPASNGQITSPDCIYAANRSVAVAGSRIGGSEEALCVPLTAGQTVYAIVDEAVMSSLPANFNIEVSRCVLEREFNGSPAAADNVDADGDGTPDGPNNANAACPVEGQILTFPGFPDIDFYTLGVNPGARLFAMVDCNAANPNPNLANSTDIDMRVTTTTDTLEFDDGDNSAIFATLCPNVAGTPLPLASPAYIRLNAFSTTQSYEPYRLSMNIRPAGPNPPFIGVIGTTATAETAEPNDASFQFSDYVYGTSPATPDYDYYAFSARKGDFIMVNLDGDPTRDTTGHRSFFILFDPEGNTIPVGGAGVSAAATSVQTPSPGTLTANTPRSGADAIVTRAGETGAFFVVVRNQLLPSIPASAGDYLYQVSLNCNQGAAGGGLNADMAITKTGPAAATAGSDITYTITVTNNGPNPALLASWTDNVPAGTTFVALEAADGWTCATPNPGDTGPIQCDEDTITFDGSAVFTLTVHVAGCSGNGVVSNTAETSSATPDADLTNNSSTVVTTVTDPGTCDDGDACTVGDHCDAGACVGTPRNCDDSNACTDDACNPATGCEYTNNTGPCDDGNSCTNGDACSDGSCHGTNAPAGQACATDNNPCTNDGCDGNGACVHVANTDPCNDNSACTTGDHCSGGSCVGTPLCCDDGNVCTTDTCDPSTGCVNACNNNCNAKGDGYWKKLCNTRGSNTPCGTDDHGDDHGEFLTQKDVDCVNNSCTFSDVQTVDQLCSTFDDHGGDKCAKAEKKFMTLLLNVCRCRLNPSQTIDTHCEPHHQTVAEVIAHEDATLCNPARTQEQCKHPDCSADEVTNGEALWQNTLRLTRQGTAVRLTWSAVYGDPNTESGQPRKYRLWRHLTGGTYTMIGEVNANTFTFLDTTAGTGNYWYEVTATY